MSTYTRAEDLWDSHTAFEVGMLVRRYLEWHPAPPGDKFASDLSAWATEMAEEGATRLRDLGRRSLRAGDTAGQPVSKPVRR
jgi:hypothetical protein